MSFMKWPTVKLSALLIFNLMKERNNRHFAWKTMSDRFEDCEHRLPTSKLFEIMKGATPHLAQLRHQNPGKHDTREKIIYPGKRHVHEKFEAWLFNFRKAEEDHFSMCVQGGKIPYSTPRHPAHRSGRFVCVAQV